MKAKIPFEKHNPKAAAASKAEIQKQLIETNAEYELEVDALFLWVLHTYPKYRLGLSRIKELYEEVFRMRKEIYEFYKADPKLNKHRKLGELKSDNKQTAYWISISKLLDYGFDIKAEFERLDKKYKLD